MKVTVKVLDIVMDPFQFWIQNCLYFYSWHSNWKNHCKKKKEIEYTTNIFKKVNFKKGYTILIWDHEGSWPVLIPKAGFWQILMGPSSIEMVIKAPEAVLRQFWMVQLFLRGPWHMNVLGDFSRLEWSPFPFTISFRLSQRLCTW